MCAHVPKLSKRDSILLLSSNKGLARFATIDSRGKPHVVPVWFVFREDRFYIPSPMRSLKARNAKARPDVCLVLDSYGGKLDAKGLLFKGRATLVKGEKSSRLNYSIHEKYMGSKKLEDKRWKEFMAEDDATIVVRPSFVRSWDFTKLRF